MTQSQLDSEAWTDYCAKNEYGEAFFSKPLFMAGLQFERAAWIKKIEDTKLNDHKEYVSETFGRESLRQELLRGIRG